MNSIRVRLLLVLLAVGLVPMIAVVVVSNQHTRQALEASEREKIAAVNREISRQVGAVMRAAANDLVALGGNRVVTGAHTPMGERVAEMRRLVNAYQMFDDITLYDSGGFKVSSTTDRNHPEPVEKTLWFQSAIGGGDVVTSRPHRVLGQEGLHLKVYMPLRIAGIDEPYVLRARLKFEPVWELIDGARIGERGQALLLDPRGTLIAGRDKERILRTFTDDREMPFWSSGRGLAAVGGEPHYFHSEAIDASKTHTGEPWILVCLRPQSEVLAAAGKAVTMQTLIAVGVVLATGGLGIFLAQRFASPVVAASLAARRVSEGDLSARVPEGGADELRQLATSFNAMVDEVRNHRFELEAMVDSRTEKLIDSQRQLEDVYAQLRASYEAAKEGILVVGIDGVLIAANQRVIDFFGLGGDLQRMTALGFQEQAEGCFSDSRAFSEVWEAVNSEPDQLAEGEWELVSPVERSLSVYSAPVTNSRGRQIARLWTFQDVTDQRQLQKSLEQAQKMEAVGRLAGGVAHDFNNLLTGIIGNLSLVEMGGGRDVSGAEARFISSAKKAGQRAAELVKKLLGFSRQSHLELSFCDVNEVIADVEGLLASTLDPRISIVTECESELWGVEADATQVEQVVMNMCVNAKDALGEGGGRITLRSSNRVVEETQLKGGDLEGRGAGDYVVISVEDDGSGMSEEVLSKIFEPFFTTKEQGKGTGLGLATSYGIVQQHGGWIDCDSELGRGTAFNIFLPRKDRPVAASAESRPSAGEIEGGQETILLVDDEQVVRSVAEGILKHHGYQVLLAGDGEEALEVFAANEGKVGLVMLDLTMPKMSGRDTLVALRERYGDIPIMVCSGYLVDLEGFEEETGYRPDDAIQKPYNVKDLARRVRAVLDGAELAV